MSEKFVEHQIRYTWRSIYKMHNEQALKAGGTLAQAVVLLNLNPNKGTPSTSLGPKMGLESTSLGRTLKSMENAGFISRVPNKDDKRGVFIVLTKKGKELRAISKMNGNKFNKVVLNKIGEPYIKSKSTELNSNSGLGLGTFLGKTLLEKQGAKLLFRRNNDLGGALVVISWNPKNLVNS